MSQFLSIMTIGVIALLVLLCVVALPLAVVVLLIASFVLWIWMLLDAIRNDELSGWARVGWAVLIWFTHWIGALIYFCVARKGQLPRRSGVIAAQ